MPLTATVPSTAAIKVDGSDLDSSAVAAIESALVVDRLAMPDTFTIVFRDTERDLLSKAGLEIGKSIEISASSQSDESEAVLIKGEITSIEADYDTLGARAIVRGYDKSHRLAAGRVTKTYENVKLSDIAKQLASDAGLQTDVDETEGTHDHVFQVNQSNLDFLYALAVRAGFDCRVDGDTLLFKEPPVSTDGPEPGEPTDAGGTTLVWGVNLMEFRARMSAVAQVSEVEVRGWDPKAKEAVIGKGTPVGRERRHLDDAHPARRQGRRQDARGGGPPGVEPGRRRRPRRGAGGPDRQRGVRGVRRGHRGLQAQGGDAGQRVGRGPGAERQVGDLRVAPRVQQRDVPDGARVLRPPGPLDPRARVAGLLRQGALLRRRHRHRERERGPRRAGPGQGQVPVARGRRGLVLGPPRRRPAPARTPA